MDTRAVMTVRASILFLLLILSLRMVTEDVGLVMGLERNQRAGNGVSL